MISIKEILIMIIFILVFVSAAIIIKDLYNYVSLVYYIDPNSIW
jgi:hypothetical protein